MARTSKSLIGKVLDNRYEILEWLGEGGMGVVYKARQRSVDRIIAIKVLNQHTAGDPSWVQRFYNEAKASSKLQHPNTIRMFDFGQTASGQLFMTMEYLDGTSLRRVIDMTAPMPPLRVLGLVMQCCASLSEAHNLGIIHRDIKPDNVFVLNLPGSPDHVKLLDFSVAKLLQENGDFRTAAGIVFGTPEYMSPEQGRGRPLDRRSDLYSLGILTYEMLSGLVPFTHENPLTVLQMQLTGAVPPLPESVPVPVRQLVTRCLDKDPDRRFQSAEELMSACKRVVELLTSSQPFQLPVMPTAGAGARTMIAPNPSNQFAQIPTVLGDPLGLSPAMGGPPELGPPLPPRAGGSAATMEGPPPSGGPPPPVHHDQRRTVMLAASDGVVSYAQTGGGLGAGFHPETTQPGARPAQQASLLFWIVCLLVGVGVGVGAYLAVVEFGI